MVVNLGDILKVARPNVRHVDYFIEETTLIAIYKLTSSGVESINSIDLKDQMLINSIIKEYDKLIFFMNTDFVRKDLAQRINYTTARFVFKGEISEWFISRNGYSISKYGDIYSDRKGLVSKGKYNGYNNPFKDAYRVGENGFISPTMEDILGHFNYMNDRLNNFIAEQKKQNGPI